jgi:hypothetical protein
MYNAKKDTNLSDLLRLSGLDTKKKNLNEDTSVYLSSPTDRSYLNRKGKAGGKIFPGGADKAVDTPVKTDSSRLSPKVKQAGGVHYPIDDVSPEIRQLNRPYYDKVDNIINRALSGDRLSADEQKIYDQQLAGARGINTPADRSERLKQGDFSALPTVGKDEGPRDFDSQLNRAAGISVFDKPEVASQKRSSWMLQHPDRYAALLAAPAFTAGPAIAGGMIGGPGGAAIGGLVGGAVGGGLYAYATRNIDDDDADKERKDPETSSTTPMQIRLDPPVSTGKPTSQVEKPKKSQDTVAVKPLPVTPTVTPPVTLPVTPPEPRKQVRSLDALPNTPTDLAAAQLRMQGVTPSELSKPTDPLKREADKGSSAILAGIERANLDADRPAADIRREYEKSTTSTGINQTRAALRQQSGSFTNPPAPSSSIATPPALGPYSSPNIPGFINKPAPGRTASASSSSSVADTTPITALKGAEKGLGKINFAGQQTSATDISPQVSVPQPLTSLSPDIIWAVPKPQEYNSGLDAPVQGTLGYRGTTGEGPRGLKSVEAQPGAAKVAGSPAIQNVSTGVGGYTYSGTDMSDATRRIAGGDGGGGGTSGAALGTAGTGARGQGRSAIGQDIATASSSGVGGDIGAAAGKGTSTGSLGGLGPVTPSPSGSESSLTTTGSSGGGGIDLSRDINGTSTFPMGGSNLGTAGYEFQTSPSSSDGSSYPMGGLNLGGGTDNLPRAGYQWLKTGEVGGEDPFVHTTTKGLIQTGVNKPTAGRGGTTSTNESFLGELSNLLKLGGVKR